ncbi:hypothetical protein NSK_006844 [Nannochloropsis salina CCMP1776]|uniref:Uncharacterized protein n=1 Tax=Nannochloropsis salina CCMP1776 TaxID=1027361 RepID=A0A4D9CVS5_9STRA|nr:hypothetical protein NSK_006844 [Nannochloropsis salina CCMP1776]|eukprot:TFJ81593.1 hypothetical protein NSK_006844 [Nannochloropsis salina CCMP1776]
MTTSLLWDQLQDLAADENVLSSQLLHVSEAQRAAEDEGEAAFQAYLHQNGSQILNEENPLHKLARALMEKVQGIETTRNSSARATDTDMDHSTTESPSNHTSPVLKFLSTRGYPYSIDSAEDILLFLAGELQAASTLAARARSCEGTGGTNATTPVCDTHVQPPLSSLAESATKNEEIHAIQRLLTKALDKLQDTSSLSTSTPPLSLPLSSLLCALEKAVDVRLAALPPKFLSQDELLVSGVPEKGKEEEGGQCPQNAGAMDEGGSCECPRKSEVQLTPSQRQMLEDIDAHLRNDFGLRRQMVLKRLDVSLRSFLWTERVAEGGSVLVKRVEAARQGLREEVGDEIGVDAALRAGKGVMYQQACKITQERGRGWGQSTVKRLVIGSVPDRGGRVDALRPSQMGEGRGGGRGEQGAGSGGTGKSEEAQPRGAGEGAEGEGGGGGGKGEGEGEEVVVRGAGKRGERGEDGEEGEGEEEEEAGYR